MEDNSKVNKVTVLSDISDELLEQIKKDAIKEYLIGTGRGRKKKSDSYKKRIQQERNRKNILKKNAKEGIIGYKKCGRRPKDDPNRIVVIPIEDLPPLN
jgi:hypothetical protein